MYSNGGIYIPDRKPPMGALLNPYLEINRGLALNLIMWEDAGNTVEDLNGNHYDGIITGSPPWIPGKSGPALKFEGNDEIDSTGLYVTDTATIIMRLKIDDVTGSRFVMDCRDGDMDNVQLYHRGTTEMVELWDSAEICRAPSGTSGSWYDWAFIFNGVGKAGYIYIDGVRREAAVANQNTTNIIENRIEFGCRYTQTVYLLGALEYLMIYNPVLSASKIALLHREPFCGFRWMSIEQLAAYYEEEPPPEIQALFMDLSTQIWTIKHATGLFTKL